MTCGFAGPPQGGDLRQTSRLCDFTDWYFPSHNSLVEDRGYATSLTAFSQLFSGRSRLCDFTDCFFPSHNSLVEDRGYATSLPQSQLTDCSLVEDRGYATSLPQSLTGIYCYLIYFPSKCGQIGYDRCTLDLWTLGQERCTFFPPYWTY